MYLGKQKCITCNREIDKIYKGMCQRCYCYFYTNKYKCWKKPIFGQVGFVTDKKSKQYGMCICHICGKAYIKLQQHVYYEHHLTKNEYCERFGLDKKVRLTSDIYNKKMSDYAYKYKMDEQVKNAGKNTRFKKGVRNNYIRSYMTRRRLQEGSYRLKQGQINNKEGMI